MADNSDAAYRDTVTGEGLSVFMSSVWLVFLLFPALAVLAADVTTFAKAAAVAALLLFAVVYVMSWRYVRPRTHWSPAGSLVFWLAVLLVAAAPVLPALGVTTWMLVPYFMAQVCFKAPVRPALLGTVLIAVGASLGVWISAAGQQRWMIALLLVNCLVFVILRAASVAENREANQRREMALLREREQFARDVHDVLGHSLTVVTVKTELARKLLESDPTRAAAELDDVLSLARESLTQVRSSVGRLRSPDWMEQLGAARSALEAAGVEVVLPERPDLVPAHQQETFARCLREAVTNVVRHAGASRCVITAESGRLVVTDDGVGLTGDAKNVAGTGITGLRRLVAEVGGTLSLGPADPKPGLQPGTRLEVSLP